MKKNLLIFVGIISSTFLLMVSCTKEEIAKPNNPIVPLNEREYSKNAVENTNPIEVTEGENNNIEKAGHWTGFKYDRECDKAGGSCSKWVGEPRPGRDMIVFDSLIVNYGVSGLVEFMENHLEDSFMDGIQDTDPETYSLFSAGAVEVNKTVINELTHFVFYVHENGNLVYYRTISFVNFE